MTHMTQLAVKYKAKDIYNMKVWNTSFKYVRGNRIFQDLKV